MENVFQFDYDESLNNQYIALKWDIKTDKDGNEIACKKLIVAHRFNDAKNEMLNYICYELLPHYKPSGIIEFIHPEDEELKGNKPKEYVAVLKDMKFKVTTPEVITKDFMESIIIFLTNLCKDADRLKLKPQPPKSKGPRMR